MTHSHRFVEEYDGMPAFGMSRETDEATVVWMLQKISDDGLAPVLAGRMDDAELLGLFDELTRILHAHLSEAEYHRLFLKDGDGHD